MLYLYEHDISIISAPVVHRMWDQGLRFGKLLRSLINTQSKVASHHHHLIHP